MQLISNFNKCIRFLLCVIDIFSKYAWVIPLKDKRSITITNVFQKILDDRISVDKGTEFCNRSMKSFLQNIEIYSTHNEEESVVAERFIRSLKNEIYKYITSITKNMYIDKLDDIVNKYNNIYHSTIKIKPVDVNPCMYFDFNKENNNKALKLKLAIM